MTSRWVTAGLGFAIAGLAVVLVLVADERDPRPGRSGPRIVGHFSKPAYRDRSERCSADVAPGRTPLASCEYPYAVALVKGGGVSCRWEGSNVFVHAVLRNRSPRDRVKAYVGPRVDGGAGALTTYDDVDVTLDPSERIVVDLVAVVSRSARPGEPIRRCVARLTDAIVVTADE